MAKTEKKPAKLGPRAPATPPEGTEVLGPGVIKRPKREQPQQSAPADEAPYSPSEQVFRRR